MKNRQIMSVWMSLETATAAAKTEKPKFPSRRGSLRPRSSDKGAQRAGPTPYPTRYRVLDREATSTEMWKYSAIRGVAADRTAEAKVEHKHARAPTAAMPSLWSDQSLSIIESFKLTSFSKASSRDAGDLVDHRSRRRRLLVLLESQEGMVCLHQMPEEASVGLCFLSEWIQRYEYVAGWQSVSFRSERCIVRFQACTSWIVTRGSTRRWDDERDFWKLLLFQLTRDQYRGYPYLRVVTIRGKIVVESRIRDGKIHTDGDWHSHKYSAFILQTAYLNA